MSIVRVENLVKEYPLKAKKFRPEHEMAPPTGAQPSFTPWGGLPAAGTMPGKSVLRAVDGISFSIDKGEIVGYIGPNGAGKSTTIKMLTGILAPTGGEIEVNGITPARNRKKNARNIGVVFGQRSQLWWDLPVMDSFRLLKHIYDIPGPLYRQNLEMFTGMLGLSGFIHQPVRQLSLGQRMRADIAAALLHNPEVLFLDEPTIGLDTMAKESMREFIRMANRDRNITVILTTHDMSDMEQLCRRVMIIDRGRLAYDGSIERIREKYGRERVLVVDFANDDIHIPPQAVLVGEEGPRKWFSFDRNQISASGLIDMLSENNEIADLSIREESIESIIRRLYTDNACGTGGINC